MAKSDAEFHALMQQVISGSESAAIELFRDYEPYLLHAIRKKLSKKIRSKFDSADFTQDVWASFFAQEVERRVFATPDDLIRFLIRLAQNKVIDTTRQRLKQKKFNVNREQSLDDSQRFDKERLAARQATPSQIAMSQEEWRKLLSDLPLVYRRILVLLRDGVSFDEIAAELKIHPRTVRRVADRYVPGLFK